MSKTLLVSFILFFLLSVNLAAALTIYVQPANQGVVRLNVALFQTATEKRSFEVKNLNNFSMTIDLQPTGNITKLVDIEKSFTLQPNESRTVSYTVRVSEPGIYDGTISISFDSPQGHATYETRLTVIANKSELNYGQFIIPAIVLAAIIVLIVFFKGRWKIIAEKKRVKK
jgi:hypothetical protein